MTIRTTLVILLVGGFAAADPPPQGVAPTGTALADPPPPRRAARSLRDEATRVTSDLVAGQAPGPDLLLFPWRFRRSSANGRAQKLEAGAAAATMVGELALGLGGSALAAVGALAVGATLDAAAAEVEAASPTAPRKKPRPRHRLR